MNNGDLISKIQNGILSIKFNRPDKNNAWNRDLVETFTAILREAEFDPNIRIITMTGDEKSFSTGGDPNEFIVSQPQRMESFNRKVIELFRIMERVRKPVVAIVDGICNIEAIQAADWVIASRRALFGLPQINSGMSPGAGILIRLPKLVGKARAKDLAFTGSFISADQAKDIGIINEVVDDSELHARADQYIADLNSKSIEALGIIKQVINHSFEMSSEAGIEYQLIEKTRLFYGETGPLEGKGEN